MRAGGTAIAAGPKHTWLATTSLKMTVTLAALLGTGAALASKEPATVERFEITRQELAYGGAEFGSVGRYRRVEGKVHFSLDPKHEANTSIVDLQYAPRDARGRVSYSTDVLVLVPEKPAQGRRVLLVEIPNRGKRLMVGGLNSDINAPPPPPGAAGPRPAGLDTPADAGTGFLMRQGYTIAWIGWQADIPAKDNIRVHAPVATRNGKTITGKVHIAKVFDSEGPTYEWTLVYRAASLDQANAQLQVRAHQAAPATKVPAKNWHFVDDRTVRITRPEGSDAGAVYELTYTARDPLISGLGFAAVRDAVKFLRSDDASNPLLGLREGQCAFARKEDCSKSAAASVDFALGIGGSQSARFLRDMLWQGFNDTGTGARVFDGMLPYLAGSRRTNTNSRWAEPGRFTRQHEERRIYGDQFPFTYSVIKDPLTGKRDGLFAKCQKNETCPKVVHVDTSAEFWNAAASLVSTDGAGHDVEFPENVRAYMISSGSHVSRVASHYAQLPGNPLSTWPVLRALTVDLENWVAERALPPANRWPRIAAGELARPESREAVGFPDLATVGLKYSGAVNQVPVTDYSRVPPVAHPRLRWETLVPVTDADGNDVPGIRVPQLAAPLGTYLGWNPRKPGFAEGQISFLFGGFVPFAKDQSTRVNMDPRASIAERYESEREYTEKVRKAAEALHADSLLLEEDVEPAVAEAVAAYRRSTGTE